MKRRAFTLIELLIVVAIIAILAAIAVPNFLEAQTRAKVSRAKADQRSIATAIESYAVDWTNPPMGVKALQTQNCCSAYAYFKAFPDDEYVREFVFAKMTTPVAYITTVPPDPFLVGGAIAQKTGISKTTFRLFAYQSVDPCIFYGKAANNQWARAHRAGYAWALRSLGPRRNNNGSLVQVLNGDPPTFVGDTDCAYDPSNGTVSEGWVIRTNKGVFSTAGH